jgi:malate-CoA ligase subunit beta
VHLSAGINLCAGGSQGLVNAVTVRQPAGRLVVRLAGTNVEEGREILRDSGLELATADTLTEAAEKVVAALKASGSTAGNGKP